MTKTKELEVNDTIHSSYSFKFHTPDGVATVFIVEEKIGTIKRIDYFIGKVGSSVSAWAYALTEFINFALEEGIELNDIIIKISNITAEGGKRNISGIECRSGPEAIFLALMKYKGMLNKNMKKSVTNYQPRIRTRN